MTVFIRYQDLVSRLVYWSSLPSEDALREVKQVAASIRGVSRLPTGSLVLVLVDDTSILHNESDSKQKWIYARVAGQSQGALVLLFTNPSETILESFPYDRVIPLAPEMERKYFKEPHPDQVFSPFLKSPTQCSYFVFNSCSNVLQVSRIPF